MAKLAFDPDNLDAQARLIYDAMLSRRKHEGEPLGGPYNALMNHPELCEKIEALGFYLKFQGHLPREIYQFVVLSVACSTKVVFEWADHIKHALSAGVPQTVINTLKTQGVTSEDFPAPYLLAAKILNATLAWKNIPDDIQTEAIHSYGKEGFIEIVVLSGFYQMFSAVNQGFDITA